MTRDAKQILDDSFLEMRWRCLSLAADLDRIQRASGGETILLSDPRITELRQAIATLLKNQPERAKEVQMILSDQSPPPAR